MTLHVEELDCLKAILLQGRAQGGSPAQDLIARGLGVVVQNRMIMTADGRRAPVSPF
jgi:hypothetical protein